MNRKLYSPCDVCDPSDDCINCVLGAYRALGAVKELKRGAELVKAEGEGLLLKMPCKPGTELFGPCHIRGANSISRSYFYPPYLPKLGVDAWLTRAEAEAAMGGGGDGCTDAH